MQRLLEGIMRQPFVRSVGAHDLFFYSRRIQRLAGHLGNDAIEVTPSRIKLFTNDHRFRLRERLEARLEKIWNSTPLDKNPILQHHSEIIIHQTQEVNDENSYTLASEGDSGACDVCVAEHSGAIR